MVGEQVVVRGEAKDMIEAAQILRIVANHSPNRSRSQVQPRQDLRIQFIPGLGDEQAAVNAIRELLQGSPNLVNLLHVPGEQQVMLMVTVAEVNRTAARSIGMNFNVTKGKFAMAQVTGTIPITTATGTVAGGVGQVGGNLPMSFDNGAVLLAINALRTQNFARTLAEPNLTTLNGQPASFHAGGSFPVPETNVFTGGAAQSVVYVPFGVQLQFVPYVTDRDLIRLQVQASVSTLSTSTTQVAGSDVPSEINDRTFQTTVDLRQGQTLAVAGLIDTSFGGTFDSRAILRRSAADRPRRGIRPAHVQRAGSGRAGHAGAGSSAGALPNAAVARQRYFRAGGRGVLFGRASGRAAERRLPRFGAHRFRPASSLLQLRKRLHHRSARADVWLLQLRAVRLPRPLRSAVWHADRRADDDTTKSAGRS